MASESPCLECMQDVNQLCAECWGSIGDALLIRAEKAESELATLRARIAELEVHFPKSRDGEIIVPGAVVRCPRGHARKIRPGDTYLYCADGDCWGIGCQSDSASGTRHEFDHCSIVKPLHGPQAHRKEL